MVVFGAYIVVAAVVTVLFAVKTDNEGMPRPGTPDYALYKNTIFKDCYDDFLPNDGSNSNNCSAIQSILENGRPEIVSEGIGYVFKLEFSDTSLPRDERVPYTWCQAAACVGDYKVVPSSPRDTAFWATSLGAYTKVSVVFVAALWQFLKLHKALYSSETEPCEGVGWDLWVILAWDAASVGWWWFDFGRHASDPSTHPAPGMLGWVSLWKYGYLVGFHPYACALGRRPRLTLATKWVVNTLAFAQWVAAVYIWNATKSSYSPYPTYDCLASQVADAPGTSTCAAEEICSRDLLLRSYDFSFSGDDMDFSDPGLAMYAAFIILTLGAVGRALIVGLLPVVLHALLGKGSSVREMRERVYKHDVGYAGSIALSSVACIIVGAFTTAGAVMAFQHHREGTFVVDWGCRAVHVNLSSWRYYLDVQYERPLRAVKMWFNI